ncbi:hypothetical protein [Staphylococcus warneri]|uniref:hypothetical protein n=1 Tax=Staphylococcus warneri TaxID=1292 RepID=UPI0022E90B15|nr:hypothetical protein [Staphylococcus warneri]
MNNCKLDEAHKQIDKENKTMKQTSKGWIYESIYRGYSIMIIRVRQYGHLCGYIKTNMSKSSIEYNIIDNHFHGGVTFHDKEWIGFDCLHINDFSPYQYKIFSEDLDFDKETFFDKRYYRTLDEVKHCLVSTIDALKVKKRNASKIINKKGDYKYE